MRELFNYFIESYHHKDWKISANFVKDGNFVVTATRDDYDPITLTQCASGPEVFRKMELEIEELIDELEDSNSSDDM